VEIRTQAGTKRVGGVEVKFTPTALHAYTIGKKTLESPP